jgi:hypothetical protein
MKKQNLLNCPVCGKALTQMEYDKALGLWDEKQEHIKHLEGEQKKLREQAKKFREKELAFKTEQKKLKAQAKKDLSKAIKKERALNIQKFKKQTEKVRNSLKKEMQYELKEGIAKGVEKQKAELNKQKKEFTKQQGELKKTQNKMKGLEKSLEKSNEKHEEAINEIKRLKEQIKKGTTPQIEGLLEEDKLLAKLEELFPHDRFEHPGKGGDIIQFVIEQGQQIGKIVYECKKVKHFEKKHIEQAKTARRSRGADFAVLVTNVFPSKKQFYFVEKTVFVISPISLEPITQTLRDSLVRIYMLNLSNQAKSKAVQKVYEYLSSNEYSNKINDVANQMQELGRELKAEVLSHKRTWEKRNKIYSDVYYDVQLIDYKLRTLIKGLPDSKNIPLLPAPQKQLIDIDKI